MTKQTKTWPSPFGYERPHRPMDEMCPFCKNEDTQADGDAWMSCYCCKGKWHVQSGFKNEIKLDD